MIEQALATPGLVWLALASALAGLVRGFSGFGSGLLFMPLAGMLMPPAQAMTVLVIMDLVGPLPGIPAAWRAGNPREIGRLGLGMALGLPLGVALLVAIPPAGFRWGVSLMALGTVAALATGWRWRGARGPRMTTAVGLASGVLGGATALPGPPVILYYMASTMPVAQVRANLTMFLVLVDVGLIAMLWAVGKLEPAMVLVGIGMIVPFSLGNLAGSVMFDPGRVRSYRFLSYGLIAGAAVLGLPLVTKG